MVAVSRAELEYYTLGSCAAPGDKSGCGSPVVWSVRDLLRKDEASLLLLHERTGTTLGGRAPFVLSVCAGFARRQIATGPL